MAVRGMDAMKTIPNENLIVKSKASEDFPGSLFGINI